MRTTGYHIVHFPMRVAGKRRFSTNRVFHRTARVIVHLEQHVGHPLVGAPTVPFSQLSTAVLASLTAR